MKNWIAKSSTPREYFVLQINGRVNSMHRRYQDAVTAGLLLKHQFPRDDIKVREAYSEDVNQDPGLH
jgi:hypothetical protein